MDERGTNGEQEADPVFRLGALDERLDRIEARLGEPIDRHDSLGESARP